jgi:hypothetical protein
MAHALNSDLAHGRQSPLASALVECRMLVALFGAAVRAGRAVENRRQPDARDLRVMGIDGPIPGTR